MKQIVLTKDFKARLCVLAAYCLFYSNLNQNSESARLRNSALFIFGLVDGSKVVTIGDLVHISYLLSHLSCIDELRNFIPVRTLLQIVKKSVDSHPSFIKALGDVLSSEPSFLRSLSVIHDLLFLLF